MKKKINTHKMIETLTQRFQKDRVSTETRALMEELFIEGRLGNKYYNYNFPLDEENMVCDSPDDRLEFLNKFYESFESVGIYTFRAHSGKRECFIEYIDNLIRLEPSLSPFIVVEHGLKEHLAFLRNGIIDIGWELYTFPGDRMSSNGKIAEYIQFEAKCFEFRMLEVSVKDRKMKLIYNGDLNDGNPDEGSNNPYLDDITTILKDTKPFFGSHLKGFTLPMAVDSMDVQVLSNVKDFGFHIVWIKSNNTEPDYCFTIGLEYSYKHPEIILIGLPISTTKSIINNLGSKIRTGQRFIDDHQCINISSQKLMMKKMHPSHYRDYLGYFLWFYDSIKTPPDVMQLVWSDECGKFPWDEGCSNKCVKSQKILNK